LDDVSSFWNSNSLNGDPENFFHHYSANGWTQGGKARLVSWQSAAKKWSRREHTFPSKTKRAAIGPGQVYDPNAKVDGGW
jgi:hypothetical protein